MDCGAGVLPALPRHAPDWHALSHVAITHFHIDHVVELPAILFALKHAPEARERTEPLRILGPDGTTGLVSGLEEALGYEFTRLGFDVSVEEIGPGSRVGIGAPATLLAHETLHTDESLALRIDERGTSLGYTGDAAPTPGLAAFFEGCDLLVADCFLEEPSRDSNHMTPEQAAELASAAGVAHLVAVHLSPGRDPGAVLRRLGSLFAGRTSVAHPGLALEI
jgi:ribonuclease BN (tRNA processing enzyme)